MQKMDEIENQLLGIQLSLSQDGDITTPAKITITSLPTELIDHIFSYLDADALVSALGACKAFNSALSESSFHLLSRCFPFLATAAVLSLRLLEPDGATHLPSFIQGLQTKKWTAFMKTTNGDVLRIHLHNNFYSKTSVLYYNRIQPHDFNATATAAKLDAGNRIENRFFKNRRIAKSIARSILPHDDATSSEEERVCDAVYTLFIIINASTAFKTLENTKLAMPRGSQLHRTESDLWLSSWWSKWRLFTWRAHTPLEAEFIRCFDNWNHRGATVVMKHCLQRIKRVTDDTCYDPSSEKGRCNSICYITQAWFMPGYNSDEEMYDFGFLGGVLAEYGIWNEETMDIIRSYRQDVKTMCQGVDERMMWFERYDDGIQYTCRKDMGYITISLLKKPQLREAMVRVAKLQSMIRNSPANIHLALRKDHKNEKQALYPDCFDRGGNKIADFPLEPILRIVRVPKPNEVVVMYGPKQRKKHARRSRNTKIRPVEEEYTKDTGWAWDVADWTPAFYDVERRERMGLLFPVKKNLHREPLRKLKEKESDNVNVYTAGAAVAG